MAINEGRLKSRTLRRINRITPSRRAVIHYIERKPAKAKCPSCGKVLHGVPRATANQMSKISKTERRPERIYGGMLCSPCSRTAIIAKYRNIFSLSKK